jgi:hypothetical protein
MSWSQVVAALHVLVAFWFVAGLIGRGVALSRARRATDLTVLGELLQVAERFDKLMVIPGSAAVLALGLLTMWAQHRSPFEADGWWLGVSLILFLSLIPLVPLVFLPEGKKFEAAFEDAKAKGMVTPELAAAFANRKVAFARNYELAVVGVVIVLMVTKPF